LNKIDHLDNDRLSNILEETENQDSREKNNDIHKHMGNRIYSYGNINSTLVDLDSEIREIELNSDLKLADLLKNNPNYLSLKTNFKPEEELNEDDIYSEEALKSEIEKLEIQIVFLTKKNKKPIDFILDRFSIQDHVLVKIIKIFENSLEEVINDIKTYFEDIVYFQFKVADKYNTKSKGNKNSRGILNKKKK